MADIDDKQAIKELDKAEMFSAIWDFPQQVRNAIGLGYKAEIEKVSAGSINNIVVTGMGGSAIGGDLLGSFLSRELKAPMVVNRDYSLPGFVDEQSLVFVISYSGNTEESLSAYAEALKKGAQIIAVSSGGKLSSQAKEDDNTLITVPGGLMPRAALGYLFFPLLIVMGRLGFCRIERDDLEKLTDLLEVWRENYRIELKEPKNKAKSIARKLYNRLPIIYAGGKPFDVVGARFKAQLCENSKALSFNNVFPEFNHNELVGYENLPFSADRVAVLIIADKDDNPRTKKRMDIVRRMFRDKGIEVIRIKGEGAVKLERIFSLIQLADFSSFYLAIMYDCDPTVIEPIEFLKRELAGFK